jgi:transcriptional regulator with XRE-family HTH domain
MTTLKEMREKAGLTQTQLAQKIGTSYTRVSDWERGVSSPSLHHFNLLARALEVSLDDLAPAFGLVMRRLTVDDL